MLILYLAKRNKANLRLLNVLSGKVYDDYDDYENVFCQISTENPGKVAA